MEQNKKSILMIANFFPPVVGGSPLRTLKLAKHLAKKMDVTVLATSNPQDIGNQVDWKTTPKKEDGIKMLRVFSLEIGTLIYPVLRLLGKEKAAHGSARRSFYWVMPCRHLGWFPFAFIRGKIFLLRNKVDWIYAAYPSPTSLMLGYWLSLIFRKPLVLDMHDSYYGVVKEFVPTRFHRWIAKCIEGRVARRAQKIGVATQKIADEMIETHKLPREKFFLLPQSIETQLVDAVKIGARSNKFTITYTGALSEVQNIPPLVKAVTKLVEEGKLRENEIQVKIAGPENKVKLEEIKALDKFGLVEYLGLVGYEESIELMKASDVLFLSLAFEEKLKYAHPSKIFEYIACGKPLLAFVPEGEASKFVRENRCGLAVTVNDANELAKAIMQLKSDAKLRQDLSNNSVKTSKRYDSEVVTEEFMRKIGVA
ncbi:D-inositol-3-phosphate glycosyltransferase [Candidatus Gugararchaeum adminiculabundum]|nr:D-inositol-3-phosphate glycosyltransferase [Candidatus Gugararchaeum adminiculabundum]